MKPGLLFRQPTVTVATRASLRFVGVCHIIVHPTIAKHAEERQPVYPSATDREPSKEPYTGVSTLTLRTEILYELETPEKSIVDSVSFFLQVRLCL